MKISFDLRLAGLPGGGHVYVAGLVPALLALDAETTWRFYLNPRCPEQQRLLERWRRDYPDRRIETVAVGAPCLSLRQHGEFLRFRDNADLYHYPHFDLPAGLRGIPLVVTIHDLYPISVPNYCDRARRFYFRLVTAAACRRATRVIAISRYTQEELVRRLHVAPEKITVIPQCVSPEYRPITDAEILAAITRKYALPERFILYTGNHKPHKNLPRLLAAYARLPERHRREFPLVLTGAVTKETRELMRQAGESGISGQVRFLGHVAAADMPPLYSRASLLVHPSTHEGFGLAPLEAMACGTAALCATAGAIPEVVGDAARLFDPNDIDSITEQLKTALDRDIEDPTVIEKGRRQAGRFTPEARARRTLALYRACVHGACVNAQ